MAVLALRWLWGLALAGSGLTAVAPGPPAAPAGSYAGAAQLLATPGGTVWAVNNSLPQGESVFRSTDDGRAWTRTLTVELPSTDCCGLAASYFFGPDDAWAVDEVLHGDGVGETTTVYGTDDGGARWWRSKGLPGDMTTADGAPLFDQLYFANPDDGWLLGTGEQLLPNAPESIVLLWWSTTDGGRTWAAMPSTDLPMQGKVIGSQGSSPCPSSSPPHLTFVSESTGWLSEGTCGQGAAHLLVWRTTDGGKDWAPVALPAPAGGWGDWYVDGKGGADLGQVRVLPDGSGTVLLAPVATGTSGLVVERSTDLGHTWAIATDVQLPALPEDGDPADWFDPLSATAWVEALPSGVMRTVDGGRHWGLVESSLSLAYSGTPVVSFTQPARGFVLGDNLTIAASTDDGGREWALEQVPSALYAQLAPGEGTPVGFVDQVSPSLQMASGPSGLWVSRDGGQSWSGRLGPTMPVTQLDAVGPSLSFALAGGEILRTTDNGLEWSRLLQPAAGPASSVDFWSADAGVAFVDGANYVIDGSYYVTADAGAHWRRVSLPAGWNFTSGLVDQDGTGSLCFTGAGTGWAAGTREVTSRLRGRPVYLTEEQLFVSTDAGQSWRAVLPSSDLPQPDWAASGGGEPSTGAGLVVAACNGDAAWAVSYQPAGLGNMQGVPVTFDLLYSGDLGASWQDVLRSSAYEEVARPKVASPPGGPAQAGVGFSTLTPQALSPAPGTALGVVWLTAYNENFGGVAFATTADRGTQWYFPGQEKSSASPLPVLGWTATAASTSQTAWALFSGAGQKGRQGQSALYMTDDGGQHWSLVYVFAWPKSLAPL